MDILSEGIEKKTKKFLTLRRTVFVFCLLLVFTLFSNLFPLSYLSSQYHVELIDNDAYSYVDEFFWVREHGLFAPEMRPLTGNMPKPLLVALYGVLYRFGGGAVSISIVCITLSLLAVLLVALIGKKQHSLFAGVCGGALLCCLWSYHEAVLTANSTLFLLVDMLLVGYLFAVLPPGVWRARGILALLFLGSFCRPEAWILYFVAWVLLFQQDIRNMTRWTRYRFYFAPLFVCLMPLVDRALFGHWFYSRLSFQYFADNFLRREPAAWSMQLVGGYLDMLIRIAGGLVSALFLLYFAFIGVRRVYENPSMKASLLFLSVGCGLLALFHLNTFRWGFFPPRFVMVPHSCILLFSGIGIAQSWGRIHDTKRQTSRNLSRLMNMLYLVMSLLACYYINTAVVEVKRGILTIALGCRFMREAIDVCRSAPYTPTRVLVANAYFNPLRWQTRRKDVDYYRVVEQSQKGVNSLSGYHVLCLGIETGLTRPIFDLIEKEPEHWEQTQVVSRLVPALKIYLRKQNNAVQEQNLSIGKQ